MLPALLDLLVLHQQLLALQVPLGRQARKARHQPLQGPLAQQVRQALLVPHLAWRARQALQAQLVLLARLVGRLVAEAIRSSGTTGKP